MKKTIYACILHLGCYLSLTVEKYIIFLACSLFFFICMKAALQLPKLQSNQKHRVIPCFNASSFSLVQNTNADNIAFPEASQKNLFLSIIEAENKHFKTEMHSSVNRNDMADIY